MRLTFKFLLSTVLAFLLAFAFNFLFLDLYGRPLIDQILLVGVSTAALTYLLFSIFTFVQNKGRSPSIRVFHVDRNALINFLRENIPGLLLALVFFFIYIKIGLQLNRLDFDTTDNYLDADNSTWISRISAPDGFGIEMRGPHPFAYFVFRPLGWVLNLFTHNYLYSAILLNTFVGALCVFMAWLFIRRQFQNSIYALLIAALLGLSTAHIFFGSVVESYIFSAAALIGFTILLQSQRSTETLAVSSLLTFGITLTNFVQNFIGMLVSRPRWKEVFRFTALTISLGVVLSVLHAAWYPTSKLFFLLSGVRAEDEFSFSIFSESSWRAIGRIILLVRTILLYAVIAPEPHVFGKDVGGTFPRFNFFKISPGTYAYSNYDGVGNLLVMAWAVLLLIAGVVFLRNLIRTRKADLSLAFALSLLFNFTLHLNYGYEPFLYSPDWTYALIFFVAFGLAPFAKSRWFQYGLFIFLALLAYNQFQFFVFIFQKISPFIS
jgi:hypothetical protein